MRLKIDMRDSPVSFQIAPMIDVVFVIMLFFMVMAGEVKIENELNIKLPGTVQTANSMDFVDDIIIGIDKTGQVTLNDDNVDTPNSTDLPQLKVNLARLKEASDAAKSQAVVTIVSDEDAKFGRTVNVLDSLAYAKISTVTFSLSDSGE